MRSITFLYSLLVHVAPITRSYCSDILAVFTLPYKSPHYVLEPLIIGLADRGYRVNIYSIQPFGEHPNITQKLVDYNVKESTDDITNLGQSAELLLTIHEWGYAAAMNFMTSPEFKELMTVDKKYDAIITTIGPIQEFLALLVHRFNTVVVDVIPHSNMPTICDLTGIPYNPSYFVDLKLPYTDRMNFFQRLHNTFSYIITTLLTYHVNIRKMSNLVQQYARYPGWETRPPLEDLLTKRSLILANGHHTLNYPYPQPPNIVDIAGITIESERKPLPKDLNEFINNWPNGVVVLCWGSLVKGVKIDNVETKKALLMAFGQLKFGVIWKTNEDSFPISVPDNVRTMKWLPQQDLLAHKKIKVFATHGGFNSMVETVHFGVPVVVTPFYYDQGKNARKYVDAGMGILLPYENLTSDSLVWAINEVADNKRYKEAAMRRSAMFRDRPMSPLQEAIFWTEYVIKHGDVLRPASTDMPYYQLLLLDVAVFCIITVFIVYYVIKKILLAILQTPFHRKTE